MDKISKASSLSCEIIANKAADTKVTKEMKEIFKRKAYDIKPLWNQKK